jgi:hypothetical protein
VARAATALQLAARGTRRQPLSLNFSLYITFSLYFLPYFFISRSGFS